MTNEIDRPIFIVGTGRCGSTVLNKIMAEHPHLAFLTTASNILPGNPGIQRQVLKMWHQPLVGTLLRKRIIAGEGWNYWDKYIPGFSRSYRDFRYGDVTQAQILKLRKEIPKLLSDQRYRLLFKFTGWTRIGFIKEVFPDARIIHITRDPRAVVNSMLHIDFWTGRLGPYHLNWGGLTQEEMNIWDRYNQSFIVLALIEYKRIMNAYQNSVTELSDGQHQDLIEISYSELCENPESSITKILQFCDLDKHPDFIKKLSSYELHNQNNKWKKNLTVEQQSIMEDAIKYMGLNIFDDL